MSLKTRIARREFRISRREADAAYWRALGREDLARRCEEIVAEDRSALAVLKALRDTLSVGGTVGGSVSPVVDPAATP
jgi:hypothetical protein